MEISEILRELEAGLRYRSERAENDGERFVVLRSSLWVERDKRRQMLFYQGTRVMN